MSPPRIVSASPPVFFCKSPDSSNLGSTKLSITSSLKLPFKIFSNAKSNPRLNLRSSSKLCNTGTAVTSLCVSSSGLSSNKASKKRR